MKAVLHHEGSIIISDFIRPTIDGNLLLKSHPMIVLVNNTVTKTNAVLTFIHIHNLNLTIKLLVNDWL